MYFDFRTRWDGGSGSTSTSGGQKLVVLIEVETDTPGISAANIIGALAFVAGIFKGVGHPDYPAARCTAIDAQQSGDDPLFWRVEVTYEEPAPTYGGGELYSGGDAGGGDDGTPATSNPAPEDRPPDLKVTFRRTDVYPERDLNGAKFENRAGDRFDNPPPVPRSAMLIEFTTRKAFDAWTAAIGRAFFNKVNSDTWQGFAARTCAVIGLTATLKSEAGYLFWELAWQIEAGEQDCENATIGGVTAGEVTGNKPPFADRVRIPHYGYNALQTGDDFTTKYEITLGTPRKPLASPAKLNWNGTLRAVDQMPLVTDFKVRESISFAGL